MQDIGLLGENDHVCHHIYKAVMAIEIACGKRSIAKDGLEDEENPTAIIKPYGTLQAEMSGALEPDKPLVITAAVFEDGKEEGVMNSLELMHKVRNRQRESLKARKHKQNQRRLPSHETYVPPPRANSHYSHHHTIAIASNTTITGDSCG